MIRGFVLVVWLLAAAARGAESKSGFIRGVTVSAQTWGGEWETPEMIGAIDELKSLGANWIAIHPYARIQPDGSLRFSENPAASHIAKPLQWAAERGVRVMLVPHIAYWGTPFLWRGDINFNTARDWNRFFSDYEKWIVLMARAAEAHHAEIFCVGLEYSHAQKYENRWRQIIAAVREVYHGRITYGANWNEFDNVPFWDAVDDIGVLAYFPLSSEPDPTAEQLAHGWRGWMAKLGTLSQKYGKPVLFTEIGYNENERCAAEPWDFHRQGGPTGPEVQARCIEQALRLEVEYPFLAGMFFWKWFPDLPSKEIETFDLRRPWIKSLLAKYWMPVAQGVGK